LLEKGADEFQVNVDEQAVLHKVAACCMDGEPIHTPLMDILLSYDVKVNQQDNNGNTALHFMARNLCLVQAARFLISRGADVRLTNSKRNTALHECLTIGITLQGQTNHGPVSHIFDDQRRALVGMVASFPGGRGR
jgi:ankyrin repeat protein